MLRIIKKDSHEYDNVLSGLTDQNIDSEEGVKNIVAGIIADVRKRGDEALFEYTEKFDSFSPKEKGILVSRDEIDSESRKCDDELLESLLTASKRIKEYHEKQIPMNEKYTDDAGLMLGWKWKPVESAGIYVPGGKAFYPSSVLMNAIPAIVAGVKRIVMVVPTPNGFINPILLAAAKICGITEIYKVGGAQAIAALAYGTQTIAPVDKIVGPGNAYVAEAKRQVFGKVGIDMVAGPSEILVIADSNNNPRWIAADLLSQAEHDEMARSILITDSEEFASKVSAELEVQYEMIGKKDIAKTSIDNNGYAIIVDYLNRDAVEITNIIAPEHLEICTDDPESISSRIHNAGAIFLGKFTPEAIGDYIAGPSHVLPTISTARFSSGLSVMDFVKRTSMIKCSPQALLNIGGHAVRIARAEHLDAHALSVSTRLKELEGK
jgi:histidinol dehydrogenase